MSFARKARPVVKRGEAMILFTVACYTFAIAASAVDEIRGIDSMQWITTPKVAKVRHTLVREGKTLFVIDANLHFRMLPSHATRVIVLRGAPLAVAVDQTHRMTEITALYALPQAFKGEERHWYRGLALIGEDVVPVVNPAAFITPGELERLNRASGSESGAQGATA
jgi:chemotaxis signal transduction protein